MAMLTFGAKCPPLIPANDPQNAACPSLLSKQVDISKVIAQDANIGENPLKRCKYHVDKTERIVTVARVKSAGKSGETAGGSRATGHLIPCNNVLAEFDI
jgi:hypothetical protein